VATPALGQFDVKLLEDGGVGDHESLGHLVAPERRRRRRGRCRAFDTRRLADVSDGRRTVRRGDGRVPRGTFPLAKVSYTMAHVR